MNFVNELSLSEIESVFYEAGIISIQCHIAESFSPVKISRNLSLLTGYEVEQFEGDGDKWIAHIHPDDRHILEETYRKALKTGNEDCLYRFNSKNGKYIWLWQKFKVLRDDQNLPEQILSIVQEISGLQNTMNRSFRSEKTSPGPVAKKVGHKEHETDLVSIKLQEWIVDRTLELGQKIEHQKKVENKLRKRLLFEYALTKASLLLVNKPDDEAFDETLNILLEVTDSDRIYIAKNYIGKAGFLYAEREHEVCREDVEPLIDHPEYGDLLYEDIPWLYENLSNDKIIYGSSDSIPSPEWDFLREQGVKSIAVLPIYTGEEWYGYIGFDYLTLDKEWEEDALNLLRSTADLIGAAKNRFETAGRAEGSESLEYLPADAMPAALLIVDEDEQIAGCNVEFEELSGYRQDELVGNPLTEVVTKGDEKHAGQFIRGILQNGRQKDELSLLGKMGSEISLYVTGKTFGAGGQTYLLLSGFELSGSDIYNMGYENGLNRFKTASGKAGKKIRDCLQLVGESFDRQLSVADMPEHRDLFLQNKLRIRAVALLAQHNELHETGLLIAVKPFISELTAGIKNSFKLAGSEVDLHLSIPDFNLTFERALPFFMLINELLIYFFRHASRQDRRGLLKVNIQYDKSEVRADFEDNVADIASNGELADPDSPEMQFINKYLEQLDAVWETESVNGTRYRIMFNNIDNNKLGVTG